MAGQKRVLGADGSEDVSSQPASRVKKPGRGPQAVSTNSDTKVETRRDNRHEETFIQCPPASSSRVRSTIQRASTLPPQQFQSSNDPVHRSKTVPNLNSSPVEPTPGRSAQWPVSNIGHLEVTSAPTDGPTTGDEDALSSSTTNILITPTPTFGPSFPSSPPRKTPPVRPFPARRGGRGGGDHTNPQHCGSGVRGERQNHRTPAARSVRGSESSAQAISVPPPETATNASATPVRSTTCCRTTCQHQPTKEVVRGSPSSTNPPPSKHRGINNPTPHTPLGHSGNHPPPSSVGSSQLTYVSDDERPTGGLAQSTSDPGYYTPFSRISEMSDADPELPEGAPSSSSNWKGKRRASPPPPSPSPNQGSSIQEPRPSSPSLPTGSSPQNLHSPSGPSRKECRDKDSCPKSSQNDVNHQQARDHTPANDPSQSLGQDLCQCTGPCPSCHKSRPPPFPPQFHPSILHFYAAYYPHLFLPPPHMQTGYQPSHYGPPPYPYPYPVPQTTDPHLSISSTQPIPPTSGYPITHSLSAPVRASPAPTPSAPALAPSISAPVRPRPLGNTPPLVDPSATDRVPPGFSEALDQFYQPLQHTVNVVDPSFDPRSPYSKRSTVPAFPNR